MTRSGLMVAMVTIVAITLLSACRAPSGGSGGDSHSHSYSETHYRPSLEAFHIVDSYAVSSEDPSNPHLIIDPYIAEGQFEFYWYADNLHDYTIEFRINDAPRLQGSRLVSSDYCGAQLDCDRDGIQYCRYYTDFSMSCDPPDTVNPNVHLTYFDDMITTIPQTMYLIVDLCDTRSSHCEYLVRDVLLE